MPARAEALMGTTVTIEASGVEREGAIDRAFGWFHTVEQTCTRFDPGSELCRLTGQPRVAVPVSRLLFEAVRFALGVAEASKGAFDPTVGAAMHRRGFDREHRTGVRVAPLLDSTDRVSFRDITIDEDGQTITLHRPLLLDLGAVAKGFAIDLAARELEPCRDFAIDAGGDLYVGGANGDGQPWSIGIRHPRLAGECITAVPVSNQAICTSGDYERRAAPPAATRDAGHHIIDPRTGVSPERLASVTVIASSAMVADALATAAFVIGAADGPGWLEQMGVDGLFVTTALDMIATTGWPGE